MCGERIVFWQSTQFRLKLFVITYRFVREYIYSAAGYLATTEYFHSRA